MTKTTQYTYSDTGKLIRTETDQRKVELQNPEDRTQQVADGNAVATSKAAIRAGGQTVTMVENHGQIQSIQAGNSVATTTSYDKERKPRKVAVTTPQGEEMPAWEYSYDDDGNLLEKFNTDHQVFHRYAYENNRRKEYEDPAGCKQLWEHDAQGNETLEQKGVKYPLRKERVFSQQGLKTNERNVGGDFEYQYDFQGNIQEEYRGKLIEDREKLKLERDAAGNITRQVQGQNMREISYLYDAYNRLLSVEEARGKTSYAYDGRGNLKSMTDPKGGVHQMEMDADGQLLVHELPNGKRWSNSYSSEGKMEWRERPDGTRITHSYDASGQLERQTSGDETIQRKYFEEKTLLWASNNLLRFQQRIDQFGRLEAWKYHFAGLAPFHVNLDPDAAGKREALWVEQHPGPTEEEDTDGEVFTVIPQPIAFGERVSYSYLDSGLISEISGPSFQVKFTYNTYGQLTAIERRNGSETQLEYHTSGRLKQKTDQHGSTTYQERTYAYDSTGDLIKIEEGEEEYDFQYDGDGQLIEAVFPQQSFIYAYDVLGNRRSEGTAALSYDEWGKTCLSDSNWDYLYDDNGFLVEKTAKSNSSIRHEFEYSVWGQLVAFRHQDGGSEPSISARYHFGPTGKRIGKEVIHRDDSTQNRSQWWLYDGDNLLLELNESQQVVRQYFGTPQTDHVLGFIEGGETYYYLKDHDNSVTGILDDQGQLLISYRYDPFGKLLSATPTGKGPVPENSLLFQSRELDTESESYFFRNRQYDPGLGRFLQPDPHPGNLYQPISVINGYVFANNNPLRYSDPHGLFFLATLIATFLVAELFYPRIGSFLGDFIAGLGNLLTFGLYDKWNMSQGLNWFFKLSVSLMILPIRVINGLGLGIIGYVVGGVWGLLRDGDWSSGANEGFRVGWATGKWIASIGAEIVLGLIDLLFPENYDYGVLDKGLAAEGMYLNLLSQNFYSPAREENNGWNYEGLKKRIPHGSFLEKEDCFSITTPTIDTQGFIFRSAERISIVFKGTGGKGEILRDAVLTDILKNLIRDQWMHTGAEEFLLALDAKLGKGFLDAYRVVRNRILEWLKADGSSNVPVFITGHSLGSAIAICAALDITETLGRFTLLYGFGSPRPGNPAFVDRFHSKIENNHLIQAKSDFATLLPPTGLGYQHLQSQTFFDAVTNHPEVEDLNWLPPFDKHLPLAYHFGLVKEYGADAQCWDFIEDELAKKDFIENGIQQAWNWHQKYVFYFAKRIVGGDLFTIPQFDPPGVYAGETISIVLTNISEIVSYQVKSVTLTFIDYTNPSEEIADPLVEEIGITLLPGSSQTITPLVNRKSIVSGDLLRYSVVPYRLVLQYEIEGVNPFRAS